MKPGLHLNDQLKLIGDISNRLASASRAGHWQALRHIDQELSDLLPRIDDAKTWNREMQQAMLRLQTAHRDAFRRCAQASENISQRLIEMHGSKDGWMAYAQHSDWNESAS